MKYKANPTALPRLSAEVFSIPLDGERYLIYAPLRRAAFVGNAQTVNFLAGLKANIHDAAADPDGSLADFLRQIEMVDAEPETPPAERFTGTPEPCALTLLLTTSCNLRCTYCYASAGDTPQQSMPLHVAKRGIDFIIANALRKKESHIELGFHGGGEPTLNRRTMTGALAYARERGEALGLEVTSHCATNGILTDRQIEWMTANLQGASVSFDGLPEIHDAYRKTASGGDSSRRVMHTLRRFDEAGFPYGIRVTVTAGQIPKMADSIDFICTHFRTPRIQVEPAYRMGRWKDAPSAETREFIAGFRAAQARARKHGRNIYFSGARAGLLTNHFCAVSRDLFALSTGGTVTSCFEAFSEQQPMADIFFYGKPDDQPHGGYQFDMERLENLRNQSVDRRKYCSGCFAKWSCAGDCHYKATLINGSGEFAGTDRCHIIRELTIDQILERIAGAGGLFWHEQPEETAGYCQRDEHKLFETDYELHSNNYTLN
ncbi:MAG: radical SAM protein [Tannerella sp.]|jgi:uncharacterized protein|nr:radical SAM protein [Tannerella sp.]